MTDREMIRACADAMCIRVQLLAPETGFPSCDYYVIPTESEEMNPVWNPLESDEQAMALLKRFPVICIDALDNLIPHGPERNEDHREHDFNRAIVKCVARMQNDR